jgi:hypothetical protein
MYPNLSTVNDNSAPNKKLLFLEYLARRVMKRLYAQLIEFDMFITTAD